MREGFTPPLCRTLEIVTQVGKGLELRERVSRLPCAIGEPCVARVGARRLWPADEMLDEGWVELLRLHELAACKL